MAPRRVAYTALPRAVALLALAYGVSAKLCLMLAALFDIVALVYVPEGVALAAGLWFGPRVWPGVLLGELVWTATTPQPVALSLAMAIGNAVDSTRKGTHFPR